MNIIISGLTAAGKTTHARLLARRLGFDYISASQWMLQRLGVPNDRNNALWVTRMPAIEALRDGRPVDAEVNDALVDALRTSDGTVFDSWALPWLAGSMPSLKIWIESSAVSRAMKARVSQEPYGPFLPLRDCHALVEAKDESTAQRMRPLLGLDIRTDRSVFDLVLDNSDLIGAPTIESARIGIAAFHLTLAGVVAKRLPARTGRVRHSMETAGFAPGRTISVERQAARKEDHWTRSSSPDV